MNQSTPLISHLSALVYLESAPEDDFHTALKLSDKIVSELGLTSVKKDYYKFSPSGITVIQILSQSHIALHFWPEINFVHIDLMACVDIRKEDFEQSIQNILLDYGVIDLKVKSDEI